MIPDSQHARVGDPGAPSREAAEAAAKARGITIPTEKVPVGTAPIAPPSLPRQPITEQPIPTASQYLKDISAIKTEMDEAAESVNNKMQENYRIQKKIIDRVDALPQTERLKSWKAEFYSDTIPISPDNPIAELITEFRATYRDLVAAGERADRATAAMIAGTKDLLKLQTRAAEKAHTIRLPRYRNKAIAKELHAGATSRIDRAFQWYRDMMAQGEWTEGTVQMRVVARATRANASATGVPYTKRLDNPFEWRSKTATITIRDKDDIGVIIHELAHTVEFDSPKIRRMVNEFLESRTVGETDQQLSQLTGWAGYKKYEMAKRDKFMNPYMGKSYADKSTEIVSMGFQSIYDNPVGFAEKDPEYFDLMMRILRGSY